MKIPDFKTGATDLMIAQMSKIKFDCDLEGYLFDKTDSLSDR